MRLMFKTCFATVLSFLALAANCQDRVLHSFDRSPDGWWTYSHAATAQVTQGKDEGNGHPGFLQLDFGYAAAGLSYLGAGVNTQGVTPTAGGLSLYLKSDKPVSVRLELRDGKETYSCSLSEVDPSWRKFSIPFAAFGPGIDYAKIKQLVVVPGKTDAAPHSLGVDEVTLLQTPPSLPKAQSFEFAGNAPPGSEILLFADDAFTVLASALVDEQGHYRIGGALPPPSYAVTPELPAPLPRRLFLTAMADSHLAATKAVDTRGAAGLDFKLTPWTTVRTSGALPRAPVFTPVSKELFGINLGIWTVDAVLGDKELQAAMREAGISLIRFPGGGRSDEQLWTRDNSKPWYDAPPEKGYSGYLTPAHLDKFIAVCAAVGATPFFTVNGRSRNAELAADIVRYANVERKYAIPYWEIGNEPEGWYGWEHSYAFGEKVASGYIETYKRFQPAMKAVDPSIKCAGPCSANRDYYDPVVKNFLAACAKTTDVVAVHRYPQDDDDPQFHFDNATLLQTPGEWGEIIRTLSAWSQAGGGVAKPLVAVTEWNTSFLHPGQRTVGLVGALWTLGNLAEMALGGVDIGCFWCLDNANYSMFAHRDGALVKRPAFHAFKLMSSTFGDGICRGVSTDPLLKVYIGESDRSRHALLLNNSPDKCFEVELSGFGQLPKDWDFSCRLLDVSRRFDAFDGVVVNPAGGATLKVPPLSALCVALPPR